MPRLEDIVPSRCTVPLTIFLQEDMGRCQHYSMDISCVKTAGMFLGVTNDLQTSPTLHIVEDKLQSQQSRKGKMETKSQTQKTSQIRGGPRGIPYLVPPQHREARRTVNPKQTAMLRSSKAFLLRLSVSIIYRPLPGGASRNGPTLILKAQECRVKLPFGFKDNIRGSHWRTSLLRHLGRAD